MSLSTSVATIPTSICAFLFPTMCPGSRSPYDACARRGCGPGNAALQEDVRGFGKGGCNAN